MGGAAALFTGLWLGDAGIAKPNLGTLLPDCERPAPGIGGRRSGAGEAISARSGGLRESCGLSATLGKPFCKAAKEEYVVSSRQPAGFVRRRSEVRLARLGFSWLVTELLCARCGVVVLVPCDACRDLSSQPRPDSRLVMKCLQFLCSYP